MARHRHRGLERGFFGRIVYAFRERQVYLRSGSDIQYITLKPMVQVVSLIVLLAALFWTAYATVNIAFKDQLLLLKERRMYEARLDYEDRIAAMRGNLDKLNDKLLLDQGTYLAKVDAVREEQQKLVRLHERVVSFFKQGWFPLRAEEAPPAPAAGKTGFNDRPFTEKYADQFRDELDALAPLAEMRRHFAAYEDMNVALLEEAVKYSEGRVAKASKLLADLGINPGLVTAATGASEENTGGPLIPANLANDEANRIMVPMLAVARNFDSYEKIKQAAAALPILSPLKEVERLTSGFGFRRDPFRRTLAFHAGIDFKGPYGEPVLATSDGVVVRAGWDGGYGRLIEITHDNGVTTRYGHLSWVAVSPGQRVKRGDIVGRLGNTGRSTGPHLHYETRVAGRAIDPVRFWRTRNDLQALAKDE
jgi:murein DD-endopeptidase MepM/ murein hydrolase activator NlpD